MTFWIDSNSGGEGRIATKIRRRHKFDDDYILPERHLYRIIIK